MIDKDLPFEWAVRKETTWEGARPFIKPKFVTLEEKHRPIRPKKESSSPTKKALEKKIASHKQTKKSFSTLKMI
jgi:hypothetical protein